MRGGGVGGLIEEQETRKPAVTSRRVMSQQRITAHRHQYEGGTAAYSAIPHTRKCGAGAVGGGRRQHFESGRGPREGEVRWVPVSSTRRVASPHVEITHWHLPSAREDGATKASTSTPTSPRKSKTHHMLSLRSFSIKGNNVSSQLRTLSRTAAGVRTFEKMVSTREYGICCGGISGGPGVK